MESLNYTQYLVSDDSRQVLSETFPPKYSTVLGDHITYEFGVAPGTQAPPTAAKVNVIGYVDSGDGIEALVVAIDGSTQRPDGSTYHITWSLDRAKYSPKDSNKLLRTKKFTLVLSIPISVTPKGT